ncbi:hypothetical protein PYW07_004404 [Mythimna separata]|uniref:Uncharacterized protein n=1 Tax=Mythimna separata TaxID=271217 RepID=A0AAD7YVP6_MYTSE|nr:hypothetical protein PYW07_004404 [Mythimna separata]
MGGVCSSVSSFVSIALNAAERISLCTVCAMLTCCILFTIIAVMVMGVGIGYHYCFVQNSVEAMAKAAQAAGALRSGQEGGHKGGVLRSVDKAVQRGFAHRLARREAESPLASNNLTYDNFTAPSNLTAINVLHPFLNLTRFNTYNFTVS